MYFIRYEINIIFLRRYEDIYYLKIRKSLEYIRNMKNQYIRNYKNNNGFLILKFIIFRKYIYNNGFFIIKFKFLK